MKKVLIVLSLAGIALPAFATGPETLVERLGFKATTASTDAPPGAPYALEWGTIGLQKTLHLQVQAQVTPSGEEEEFFFQRKAQVKTQKEAAAQCASILPTGAWRLPNAGEYALLIQVAQMEHDGLDPLLGILHVPASTILTIPGGAASTPNIAMWLNSDELKRQHITAGNLFALYSVLTQKEALQTVDNLDSFYSGVRKRVAANGMKTVLAAELGINKLALSKLDAAIEKNLDRMGCGKETPDYEAEKKRLLANNQDLFDDINTRLAGLEHGAPEVLAQLQERVDLALKSIDDFRATIKNGIAATCVAGGPQPEAEPESDQDAPKRIGVLPQP